MVATVVTNLTFHINLDTEEIHLFSDDCKSRSWVIAKTKHVDDTVVRHNDYHSDPCWKTPWKRGKFLPPVGTGCQIWSANKNREREVIAMSLPAL